MINIITPIISVILGAIIGFLLALNGNINDMDKRIVKIETVMIVKGIM